MTNQLIHLLKQWFEYKDRFHWVLGVIYQTQGPCYRKTGAMMLFGSDGQQLGMLSGGCLESDIQKHARKVMLSGEPQSIRYDGTDEDDMAFQLGIGCGGTIEIQLQPVNSENHYQQLDVLYQALSSRQTGQYLVSLHQERGNTTSNRFERTSNKHKTQLHCIEQKQVLSVGIMPSPHILVVGGGIDARPLVGMVAQLGWEVSLWDPRPANARREHFLAADHILAIDSEQLSNYCRQCSVDAAVLMSHSLSLDADALKSLTQDCHLQYLALLGPENRRKEVMTMAGLSTADLPPCGLEGPAGFDIGGELPESIALSILSQCHARLHGKL